MSSETETQREILIKMVKQIDLSKLSDSKLRKIINIIIEEEKKPIATIKSDNISSIMEKCYKEAQDIINKEKVNNKEAPKIIPMTPYEPKYGWKPIWNVELQS
jgi:SPX domain protein involved in polyphosphate accumulation